MKTYNEFMEQYTGVEMGKTNSRASETMKRRRENERAAKQRRREAEQKRNEREREAARRKAEAERARKESLKEDDRVLEPSNVHEPKKKPEPPETQLPYGM
jgi:hypothetical protein